MLLSFWCGIGIWLTCCLSRGAWLAVETKTGSGFAISTHTGLLGGKKVLSTFIEIFLYWGSSVNPVMFTLWGKLVSVTFHSFSQLPVQQSCIMVWVYSIYSMGRIRLPFCTWTQCHAQMITCCVDVFEKPDSSWVSKKTIKIFIVWRHNLTTPF